MIDQEVTKAKQHSEDEVIAPISPPLSRRVTSFFNKKKYFGSDRKHKISEKIETSEDHVVIVQETHQTPIIVFNDDTTTTNNHVLEGLTA